MSEDQILSSVPLKTTPNVKFAPRVLLKLTPNEIDLIRKSWSVNVLDEEADEDDQISSSANSESGDAQSISTKQSSGSNSQSMSSTTGDESRAKLKSPSDSMFASHQLWRQAYETLIALYPEMEPSLPTIRHQTVAFAGVMYMVVMNLEDLTRMDEFLFNLGRKHGRVFGIGGRYFKAMGNALIQTFENKYPLQFPPHISQLWERVYCYIVNVMISATEEIPVMVLNEEQMITPFTNEKYTYHREPAAPIIDTTIVPDIDSSNESDYSDTFSDPENTASHTKSIISNSETGSNKLGTESNSSVESFSTPLSQKSDVPNITFSNGVAKAAFDNISKGAKPITGKNSIHLRPQQSAGGYHNTQGQNHHMRNGASEQAPWAAAGGKPGKSDEDLLPHYSKQKPSFSTFSKLRNKMFGEVN